MSLDCEGEASRWRRLRALGRAASEMTTEPLDTVLSRPTALQHVPVQVLAASHSTSYPQPLRDSVMAQVEEKNAKIAFFSEF